MPDVVDLIMADHREVERLFEILKTQPEQRVVMLPTMATLLVAHSRAEEAEVYTVARTEAGEAEQVAHSQEEHAEAERILTQLQSMDPQSKDFDTVLGELVDAVKHHVSEEERNVLPGMKERLSDDRRAELAEAFARVRAEHLGDWAGEASREQLIQQAQNAGIPNASSMSKDELRSKLGV